jgi:hypothetical protein
MSQICSKCARVNPPDAAYCYFDGAILEGHSANGGPVNQGAYPFPSHFVFPTGQACHNFDQLALTCQQQWKAAVDLLKHGFLANFLGGLGRADLALAAQEAAGFPDQDRGLDQLLAKLPTQALQAPKILVEPTEVNLGQVALGTDRQWELHLANQGMRLLYGSVVSDCKWLTLGEAPGNAQKLFQFGTEAVIAVQVRGQHLRAGTKPLEGRLVVESNGGSATVVVRMDVPAKPFADGVLAGAVTPRQIAEKALKLPKEAAPLFEKGTVAKWFSLNGWTYPVQGPPASGLGAVQQFFEALGLAKAPKVGISVASLSLRGQVGESLHTTLEVKTEKSRPVYAYATCDQAWVDVSRTKLNGRVATINVRVPSVPNRPGETLQANINVTGNGNQRFVVPLTLSIEGASPFAELMPVEPLPLPPASDEGFIPVEPVPVANEAPVLVEPIPVSSGAAGVGAFTDLTPALLPATGAAPLVTSRAPIPASAPVDTLPRGRREHQPLFIHLVPLMVLVLALLGIMIRDLVKAPVEGKAAYDENDLRIGVYFDFSMKDAEVKRHELQQTMRFGLVKMDDPRNRKDFKKLTFDPYGRTNSTMVMIDRAPRKFASPTTGRWERKREPAPFGFGGMQGSWMFLEQVLVTQKVEIIPGDPREVAGDYRSLLDTCLVRYRLENHDTVPRTVGLRLLLDTYIGENDAPTFTVPGLTNMVDKSKDFFAPRDRIPDFVQALEKPNVQKPGIVVQFNFRINEKLEVPSRVSLTHWPGKKAYTYDVPVANIENEKGEKDSAVAIYWKEEAMAPGSKRDLGFTIGLGNVTSTEGFIGLSVGGSFTPGGELTVVALVSDPKPRETVTLHLPPQLKLVEGTETQPVPPREKLADGRFRPSPVTWRVRSGESGTFSIEVQSSMAVRQRRQVTIKASSLFN